MKNKRFAGVLAAVFLVVAAAGVALAGWHAEIREMLFKGTVVANQAGGATNTLYLFGFLY